MKKIVILVLTIGVFACNKPLSLTESIIQQAEVELKGKLNDASSYQRVNVELIDSTTISSSTNDELEIGLFSGNKPYKEAILTQIDAAKEGYNIYSKAEMVEIKKELEKATLGCKTDSIGKDSCLKLITKLKQNPILDSVKSKTYKLTYRATNGFGALTIGVLYIKYYNLTDSIYYQKNNKHNLYLETEMEHIKNKETNEDLKSFELKQNIDFKDPNSIRKYIESK